MDGKLKLMYYTQHCRFFLLIRLKIRELVASLTCLHLFYEYSRLIYMHDTLGLDR
jgi:hypothetical protein